MAGLASNIVILFQLLLLIATVCVLIPIVLIPNTSNSAGVVKISPYTTSEQAELDSETLQWRRKRSLPRAGLCEQLPSYCQGPPSLINDLTTIAPANSTALARSFPLTHRLETREVPGRNDFITIGTFMVCRRNNKAKIYCSNYGIDDYNSSATRVAVINGADFLTDEQRAALRNLPVIKAAGILTWICIILTLIAIFCLGRPLSVILKPVGNFEGEKDKDKAKAKGEALGDISQWNQVGIVILALTFAIGNLTTLFLIDEAWDLNQRINLIFVSTNAIYRSQLDVVYQLFLAAWAMTAVVLGIWLRSLHSGKVRMVEPS